VPPPSPPPPLACAQTIHIGAVADAHTDYPPHLPPLQMHSIIDKLRGKAKSAPTGCVELLDDGADSSPTPRRSRSRLVGVPRPSRCDVLAVHHGRRMADGVASLGARVRCGLGRRRHATAPHARQIAPAGAARWENQWGASWQLLLLQLKSSHFLALGRTRAPCLSGSGSR
jgi:hypothetical protein